MCSLCWIGNPTQTLFSWAFAESAIKCHVRAVSWSQPNIGDDELVYDSKRMLGATYDDLASVRRNDTRSDISRWPFLVERNRSNPQLPVVTGQRLDWSMQRCSRELKLHTGVLLLEREVLFGSLLFDDALHAPEV